jgi:phosphoenolpyruvate-protein kinase (PTS system EI component)
VAALRSGAEGAGLIRTELAFLDATAWPGEAEHRRMLSPVLAALRGRPATVRVLDFGGDKTPPFLRGTRARGLALLLEQSPAALAAQLRAALDAGRHTRLRILLPLVRDAAELEAVRRLLDEAVAATGAPRPLLGAMVETPGAAARAAELAARADFLSIGTNDLTHETLGTDRFGGDEAVTHDPRVLRHIAACAGAGRPLEVCGEAASSPLTVPLLIGLGVDELSIGAARVGTVRAWVRATRHDEARAIAAAALSAPDAGAVERLVSRAASRLELLERGDAGAEDADRLGGVVPVRP